MPYNYWTEEQWSGWQKLELIPEELVWRLGLYTVPAKLGVPRSAALHRAVEAELVGLIRNLPE